MAFRNVVLWSTACLAAVALLFFYSLFSVSNEEWSAFEAQTVIPRNKTQGAARQERMETEKALLLSQGDERRYATLHSESSTLLYSEGEGFTEKMHGITLLYQEELFQDGQQILMLTADEALYDEKAQVLKAEQVEMARYRLPGHQMPLSMTQNPFFKGKADRVDVTLTAEGPILNADGLKAEFFP
jgi:hypothetical protein